MCFEDFAANVAHFVKQADADGAHDERDDAIEHGRADITDVASTLDIRVASGDGVTTDETIGIYEAFVLPNSTTTSPQARTHAAKLLVRCCQHPGCDLPADWSEVDHNKEWNEDGLTDQVNAGISCAKHNVAKHRLKLRRRRALNGIDDTVRADGTIILPSEHEHLSSIARSTAAHRRPRRNPTRNQHRTRTPLHLVRVNQHWTRSSPTD